MKLKFLGNLAKGLIRIAVPILKEEARHEVEKRLRKKDDYRTF